MILNTHIRLNSNVVTYCGLLVEAGLESISDRHFKERMTKPEIDGQIARLPQPICNNCRLGFEWRQQHLYD